MKSDKKEVKRNNHYVPILYLKGFTGANGALCVYDKKSKKIRVSSPKAEAFERDYYTVKENNGDINDSFENTLREIVETPTAPIIAKLKNHSFPDFEEKQQLSIFIAFMLCQVPSYREFMSNQFNRELNNSTKLFVKDKNILLSNLIKYREETGDDMVNEIDSIRDDVLSEEIGFNYTKKVNLKILTTLAFKVAKFICGKKWQLIKAAGGQFFITSDNPVVCNSQNRGFYTDGLYNKDFEIIFPITQKLLFLIGSDESTIIREIENRHVSNINSLIFKNSYRHIYYAENSKNMGNYFKNICLQKT